VKCEDAGIPGCSYGKEVALTRAAVLLLSIATLALTQCSPINVSTDYDSEADFSEYHTYKWMKQEPAVPPARKAEHALLEKRVKSSVDAVMKEKGFYRVDGGEPDFLIAWHIGAQDKINVERYGYRYGPRGRWHGADVYVNRYKEGTLIIDIVDPREKQLIWRGTAVGAMRYLAKGEDEVRSSVEKLLKNFPPD
jgi:hypothetical protein